MKISQSKKSIPDQVFESLMDAIASHELKPGDRLPSEFELCEMFGVSRPSVKTAIDRLRLLGLLDARVGDGTYIREFTITDFWQLYSDLFSPEEEIQELTQLRLAIETSAFCCALAKNPIKLSGELSALTEKIQQAVLEGDIKKAARLDSAFHLAICTASENRYFIQIFQVYESTFLSHAEKHIAFAALLPAYQKVCLALQENDCDSGLSALKLLLSAASS